MNLLNCRGNLWREQLGDPIDRSEMGNFQITSRPPRVRKKLPASARRLGAKRGN
jgi:hypothetical protein